MSIALPWQYSYSQLEDCVWVKKTFLQINGVCVHVLVCVFKCVCICVHVCAHSRVYLRVCVRVCVSSLCKGVSSREQQHRVLVVPPQACQGDRTRGREIEVH